MALYEEQKMALFDGLNRMPSHEKIARLIHYNEAKAEIEGKKPEAFMKPEALKKMREILRMQGLDDAGVDKHIKEFCERTRKTELSALEKKFHG